MSTVLTVFTAYWAILLTLSAIAVIGVLLEDEGTRFIIIVGIILLLYIVR